MFGPRYSKELMVLMKLPVRKVGALIFGVLLMSISSLILSGYGTWPSSVASHEIFPPAGQSLSSIPDNAGVHQRERALRIRTDDSLKVTAQLTTSTNDPLVADVTAGEYIDFPDAFMAFYFAVFTALENKEDEAHFQWTPPSIKRTGTDRVVITVEGQSRTTNGRLDLRVNSFACHDSQCETAVEVSGTKPLVAVDPLQGITKQSETSVQLQLQSPSFSLTFDDGSFQEQTVALHLPPALWWSLVGAWRLVLLFTPWVFAYFWIRAQAAKINHNDDQVQKAIATFRPLLMGIIVISSVQAINWFQSLVETLYDFKIIQSGPGSEWFPSNHPQTVAAVVGLLALWSWRVRHESSSSAVTWSITKKALILFLGGTAIGLAVYSIAQAMPLIPFDYSPDVKVIALITGSALAVTGASSFSYALASRRSWIVDGLCAAAIVITIALASTVYSMNTQAVRGLLTFFVLVGFVVALIWTLISTLNVKVTHGHLLGRWMRAVVLVFTVALVFPVEVSHLALFPLSEYDALRIAFAAEPFLRIGLIAAGIVLLRAVATHTKYGGLRRSMLFGAMALFVLRPENSVVGIPVSFMVGLLLTAAILVKPTADVSYQSPRDAPNRIRRLLDELRAIRMDRELRFALRKRIQSGELPINDGTKIIQTVAKIMKPSKSPPSVRERDNALGWGGISNPMQRALLATVVSTVVGVLFSIPLLAEALSSLNLRSSKESASFLTTILTFRFPLYGFVFGYFLPIFKGSSGLAKATRFFVVLGASEALAILLPYNPSDDIRSALMVLLVQLAMMCGILGVGSDLIAIRSAGEGIESLADLYNMSRLALWSAGVVASVAAALITALLGAALSTATQSLLPPPPPSIVQPPPPSNVQPQNSSQNQQTR